MIKHLKLGKRNSACSLSSSNLQIYVADEVLEKSPKGREGTLSGRGLGEHKWDTGKDGVKGLNGEGERTDN